jgi:hypothetical protein
MISYHMYVSLGTWYLSLACHLLVKSYEAREHGHGHGDQTTNDRYSWEKCKVQEYNR